MKLNRQTPLFKTHCKPLKTNGRSSLKSPKNSKMEHPIFIGFQFISSPIRAANSQRSLASARSSTPNRPTGANWPPAGAAKARIAIWLLNWSVVKSAITPERIAS
jgi:hypothetical protein